MLRRATVWSVVSTVVLVTVAGGLTAAPAGAQAAPSEVVDSVFVTANGSGGIYIAMSDGRVDARDRLPHYGHYPELVDGDSVVAMAALDDASGYWLFTSSGLVYAYGSAQHHGDLSSIALAAPIIAVAARPDGGGYWMVGADGGIFAFGSAVFHGSVPEVLPGTPLAAPIVGIATSSTGGGYMLVAADGGIFSFGDAPFHGSVPGVLPGVQLVQPIVGVVPQDGGYLMVASDGGVFNFGASTFYGSLADLDVGPIASIAVPPGDIGYTMIDRDGTPYPLGLELMYLWGWITRTGFDDLNMHSVPWWLEGSYLTYWVSTDDNPYEAFRLSALDQEYPNSYQIDLTYPRTGTQTGALIAELAAQRYFHRLRVFCSGECPHVVSLAPWWYAPDLDANDVVTTSNESVWHVGTADRLTRIELEFTEHRSGIASSFYPVSADAAPSVVWSTTSSWSESAVVNGTGWWTIATTGEYRLRVTDLGPAPEGSPLVTAG